MPVFCSHQTTVISVYLLREKLFFPRQLLFLYFSPDNDCLVFIPDNSSSLFRTDDSFNFSLDNTCFLFFLVKRLSRQQLYNGISPKKLCFVLPQTGASFYFSPQTTVFYFFLQNECILFLLRQRLYHRKFFLFHTVSTVTSPIFK